MFFLLLRIDGQDKDFIELVIPIRREEETKARRFKGYGGNDLISVL